ncbi:hypothetical protein [Paenibacillus sp. HW567]|nr:hypothetical protein [Paenibacillus sp. HW567]
MKRHLSAAGAAHELFTEAAIDEIYRYSSGAARLVNTSYAPAHRTSTEL